MNKYLGRIVETQTRSTLECLEIHSDNYRDIATTKDLPALCFAHFFEIGFSSLSIDD